MMIVSTNTTKFGKETVLLIYIVYQIHRYIVEIVNITGDSRVYLS